MSNKTKVSKELLYKERLENLGLIALNVIESLMTDTETSIDVRLHSAFKVLEVFGSDHMGDGIAKAITDGLKNNGMLLEQNAECLKKMEIYKKEN
jgi:GTP cyclohydrolase II